MNTKDEDKILKIVDHSINTSLKIGNLVIQPNLPGSQKEWARPLDAVTNGLAVTLKTGKKSSLKAKFKPGGADLTFVKKF
jgi:hypothetical protein